MTCIQTPPFTKKIKHSISYMFYIRLSKELYITNNNESYIRLKPGNKYSKHVLSLEKELRNIRLKLQAREDKMKKLTAVLKQYILYSNNTYIFKDTLTASYIYKFKYALDTG